MEENELHGKFNEMLYGFLLRPESQTPAPATPRVADLYSGTGEISRAIRDRVGLDVVYAHDPDDTRNPNFKQIPDFDLLTATMPDTSERRKDALSYSLRYLRVRRPWVFVFASK